MPIASHPSTLNVSSIILIIESECLTYSPARPPTPGVGSRPVWRTQPKPARRTVSFADGTKEDDVARTVGKQPERVQLMRPASPAPTPLTARFIVPETDEDDEDEDEEQGLRFVSECSIPPTATYDANNE
jgi:hypothetical protein